MKFHLPLPGRRLRRILTHWPEIVQIMDEELPPTGDIIAMMEKLGMPIHPADIAEDAQDTRDAFLYSRNIRDKYLTSSLLWDMGLLADFAREL